MSSSKGFSIILQPIFKEAINELGQNDSTYLRLLEEPPKSLVSPPAPSSPIITDTSLGGMELLSGYPHYPLYKRIVNVISYWMVTGDCPVLQLPVMFMLNEQAIVDIRQERIESLTPKLTGAYSLWDCWSSDEMKHFIIDILKELGIRGILDTLGIRQTVGSIEVFPPPMELLVNAFVKPHHPSSKLTVGARALTKHHHRDDSYSWWGSCTGNDDDKNKHALDLVMRILSNATWINIHYLPHEVKVVEMRTIEGYGLRWLLDGTEFRGFLEPQMEDGHEVGWKH